MKYIPTQDLQKSLPAIIIFLKNRNIYREGYQIKQEPFLLKLAMSKTGQHFFGWLKGFKRFISSYDRLRFAIICSNVHMDGAHFQEGKLA